MRYGCVSHLRQGLAMTGSKNSNARILTGECYCRTVRFEVVDAFSYAMNCHCSNCRRTTGSAFKPFAARWYSAICPSGASENSRK